MNWKLKKYISGIIAVIMLFTMMFSNLILVNAAEENYDSYIIKIGNANTVTFNVSENGFNAKASKGIVTLTEKGALVPVILDSDSYNWTLSLEDVSIEAVNTGKETDIKDYDSENSILTFEIGGTEYCFELFFYGDSDQNNITNVSDSLRLISMLNGNKEWISPEKYEAVTAVSDVNGDHIVSARDALLIILRVNSMISKFPVETLNYDEEIPTETTTEDNFQVNGTKQQYYYIDDKSVERECGGYVPYDSVVIEAIPSKRDIISIGEEFYVDFKIKNNPGFVGYGFTLEYNPDVIEAVYTDNSNDLAELERVATVRTNITNAAAVDVYDLNNAIGRIENGKVSFAELSGNLETAEGDGIMFRVPFRTKALGSSNIILRSYNGDMLIDKNAKTIPSYTKSEVITVREPIKVTGIEIAEKEIDVVKGYTVGIKVNFTPKNADNKDDIVWESDNPEIAEIDTRGSVKGISEGTAVITAKYGEYSASCNVNVKWGDKIYYDERCYASVVDSIPDDATSIEVIPSKSSVVVGEEFYADFVIKNNPRFWGYSFTVSYDPDVVLPVSVDTETADVKYDYTSDIKKPAIDAEELNNRIKNPESGSFAYGGIFPTSNSGEITDAYGDGLMFRVKFKAVGEGKANVCIKDYSGCFLCGQFGDNIPVYVQNSIVESKNIVITDIILDKTEEELPIGTFLILDAKLNPENATKENILWSSSDSSVASVCQDGIVLAHKAGNAVITAKTESGEISAQCNIKVTTAPAPMGYKHGDMDGDGKLTANDAAILLRKVLDGKFIMPIENLWKNN